MILVIGRTCILGSVTPPTYVDANIDVICICLYLEQSSWILDSISVYHKVWILIYLNITSCGTRHDMNADFRLYIFNNIN